MQQLGVGLELCRVFGEAWGQVGARPGTPPKSALRLLESECGVARVGVPAPTHADPRHLSLRQGLSSPTWFAVPSSLKPEPASGRPRRSPTCIAKTSPGIAGWRTMGARPPLAGVGGQGASEAQGRGVRDRTGRLRASGRGEEAGRRWLAGECRGTIRMGGNQRNGRGCGFLLEMGVIDQYRIVGFPGATRAHFGSTRRVRIPEPIGTRLQWRVSCITPVFRGFLRHRVRLVHLGMDGVPDHSFRVFQGNLRRKPQSAKPSCRTSKVGDGCREKAGAELLAHPVP